jgi:pectinesterase
MMRKFVPFFCSIFVSLFFSANTYAQYTATWALTADKTVAVTGAQAANVAASQMVPGSAFNSGAASTDGYTCSYTASWPTAATDGLCLDFPLSPDAESNLTVTGLTTGVKISGSSGSQTFSLAYQVDGAGSWISFGSAQDAPSGGSSSLNFGSLSASFENGHTYVIRMYIYAKASGTSSSRKVYVKNVAFTGAITTANTPSITPSVSMIPTFGVLMAGSSSDSKTFTVSGKRLTSDITLTTSDPFKISSDNTVYDTAITLTQIGGTLVETTVYVKCVPASPNGKITGAISLKSTGAVTKSVALEVTAIAVEPTQQSIISFGAITGKSIVVNTAGGNGAKRIVVIRSDNPVSYIPSDGAAETGVSSNFAIATDKGNGNKVVFDGTDNTVTVTGLTSGKTYYFASFDYNAGTSNSQNYLTLNPGIGDTSTLKIPGLSVNVGSLAFGNVVYNTISSEKSCTLSANYLTPSDGNVTITSPAGFEISATSGSSFDTVVTLPYTGGALNAVPVYVRFQPTEVKPYSGNITITGGGADNLLVAVTGTGIENAPNPGNYDYIVAQDGSGGYTTVQAALNAIPLNNTAWKTVFIRKGLYVERDSTTKTQDKVIILGESRDSTIIQYNAYSGMSLNGVTLATSTCQTLYINSSDVIIKNLTVQNTATNAQAVALNVHGDRIILDSVNLLGYQDTYYTWGYGRFYHKHCYIEGATDFIFGRGAALFDSCTICSVKKSSSTVTAPSTDSLWNYGYVFKNCTFTAGSGVSAIDLGRPWKPHGQCVIINCYEGAHISNAGWRIWEGNNNHLTCYFAEYNCSGPGYTPTSRISWSHQLTDAQAANYTMENIFAKNAGMKTADTAYFAEDWTPVDFSTDVKANTSQKPKSFTLEQNYPNPFNPSTVIKYQVPVTTNVILKVYNILGKEVATLINEAKSTGEYECRFDGSHLASGLYIYTLKAGNTIQSKKMLLIK